jgi:hypothetical protein
MLRRPASLAAVAVLVAFALPLIAADSDSPTRLTWDEYVTDCGLAAQKANQARTEKIFREKYKGKVIIWPGKVTSVSEKLGGNGFTIGVAMKPTESKLGSSDILLSAPDSFKNEAVSMNSGDAIRFVGKMTSQGGAILNHQIELIRLAY